MKSGLNFTTDSNAHDLDRWKQYFYNQNIVLSMEMNLDESEWRMNTVHLLISATLRMGRLTFPSLVFCLQSPSQAEQD